jgi:hypothetical protein
LSQVLGRGAQAVARGAATLPQQEKNNYSADVQRRKVNCIRVQHLIIRMRVIVATANRSPAVSSRRAEYVDDFRAPTFIGAQPLGAKQVFLIYVPD